MTLSMLNKLEKFKNFFGYNSNTPQEVEIENNVKQEPSIDTKTSTETRICDCCGENEVSITLSEMFKIDENGQTIPLFTQPKVHLKNGGVYDDVTICESCFSTCETDEQKQYAWIAGKMNSIYKEIQAKESLVSDNNSKIEQIKMEADEKIQMILQESNGISSEINNLHNALEMYAQEQAQLENML